MSSADGGRPILKPGPPAFVSDPRRRDPFRPGPGLSRSVPAVGLRTAFLKHNNNRTDDGAARRARRLFEFTVLSRTVWVTAFGAGLIVMSFLLGGAAFNTGTNLLYLMLSMLIALFTLSIVLGWYNLNGLSISRRPPVESYAGQPAEIEVVAKNAKRWMSSYGIAVEERIAGAQPQPLATYFLAIRPRSTAIARQPVTFKRRGLVRLEGVRLGTLFPFGLLQFRSRQADPVELIVFPELVPVRNPPRRLTLGAGEHEHPEKGHGAGLHSIREYSPGDPARDIHWRISAKGGGLKVREYESESAEGVQLVLHLGRDELQTDADRDRLEKAISLTASLARFYIREEIEVMLWTAAGVVPRGTGPIHLKRILRSLALLQIDDMSPYAAPPAPPTDMTQVRIKGPAMEGDLEAGAAKATPDGDGEPAAAAAGPAGRRA